MEAERRETKSKHLIVWERRIEEKKICIILKLTESPCFVSFPVASSLLLPWLCVSVCVCVYA
jgi:hypothetical protein